MPNPNTQILENTLRKLKKEKKSIKEITEKVKINEKTANQTVQKLSSQLKKYKENEAILVKELMTQQNNFEKILNEKTDLINNLQEENKEKQRKYEKDIEKLNKSIFSLEVFLNEI